MALPFPVDIANEIIDQAADNPQSLRQLALTCSHFLPRSRYHLLAYHLCLRSRSQQLNLYAHFEANPHLQAVVRRVTLRIIWNVPGDDASRSQEPPSAFPKRLLCLPNLRCWSLRGSNKAVLMLRLTPAWLDLIRMYSGSITTLGISHVCFPDATGFAQFLLAFPGIRFLELDDIKLRKSVTTEALLLAKMQLAKQLRLTSLNMRGLVSESPIIMELLLKAGRPTVDDLVFELLPENDPNEEQIHRLVRKMSALRSITISMSNYKSSDVKSFIAHACKLIKSLSTSSLPRTHIIVVPLELLNSSLDGKEFADLEQCFLEQPLWSITFEGKGTKRCRKAFWTSTMGKHFPRLLQQGRLAIQCDESSDAYSMLGHDRPITCLAISPDGKWIASGSSDTTIIVWNAHDDNIVREWVAHRGDVNCLAFSPDGQFLMSGGEDHTLVVWDVNAAGTQTIKLDKHETAVRACAWSPNGLLLASGGENMTVRVWDAKSFAQVRCFVNEDTKYTRPLVHFSPDGRWLAFIGAMNRCNIWDTMNSRLHRSLYVDEERIPRSIAFDPTSKRIIVVAKDYTVSVWNFETGALLNVRGHTSWICDVAFSPNGKWMLSASEDKTVKVWDAHTGNLIFSLEGHIGPVRAACFSPDGKYVASASDDKTVRLWRTSNGSCLKTFTENTGPACCVLFSPNGETLHFGTDDGTLVIRRLSDIVLQDCGLQ